MAIDVGKLVRRWFHSHEEDQGDRVVYRGETYDFPRARAPRRSMAFDSDGTVVLGEPGPADASSFGEGTWSVSGATLTLTAAGTREIYQIESLEAGLLVLRRPSSGGGS